MKPASFFYALALVTLPIASGAKLLLGRGDMLWIDPTLIFSALAFFALLPEWRKRDGADFRGIVSAILILTLLSLACAASGFFLRPAPMLYNALREPLRLFLTLIWFLTSAWFLRFRTAFALRWCAVAAALALASGVLIYLIAFRLVPASPEATAYSQAYLARQSLWNIVTDIPLPRMGGFFFEAPPFGLCMLSLGVVFCTALRSGKYKAASIAGIVFSFTGAIASLADSVLPAAALCAATSIFVIPIRNTWLKPALLLAVAAVLSWSGITSLGSKVNTEVSATSVSYIESSIGQRNFHLAYGLSLLQEPRATLLGIGPGRYGEYVAGTGLFPDTTTMQYTIPEILVEWGVTGLAVWFGVIVAVVISVWKVGGPAGLVMLLALFIADSFQASWKQEAFFLAIAALRSRGLAPALQAVTAPRRRALPPIALPSDAEATAG
jgi:hypothetical protein